MKPVIKTAPAAYPVSLKEIKQHLNITVGWTEDDDYLQELLYAATKKAEQYLRRRLITQTWYAYYDEWPKVDYFVLPFGQLQSVTAITYLDTDGTLNTDSSKDSTTWGFAEDSEFTVDIKADPGRVILMYGESWPSWELYPMNPIIVEFICGYGTAGSNVEEMIKHAMKIMIADLYSNRENILVGVTSMNLRIAEDLLMPYRLHGIPT